MNASIQALSISLVSKIAHIPVIIQTEFPSAVVDFSPWLTDETTQQKFDPTSIDLGLTSMTPMGGFSVRVSANHKPNISVVEAGGLSISALFANKSDF